MHGDRSHTTAAIVYRRDKSKIIVHVLYGYQYAKGFFLSELEVFCERSRAVAVVTFLLRLTKCIKQSENFVE